MGQQQLLLIVLGVIIVGIAIVVGINLFNANAISANRDAVVADLNNLAAMAQQYYKKPTSMGGGGNSFVGWTIPSGLSSNANGTYTLEGTGSPSSVGILGVGTEKVGTDTVTADIIIYSDSVHTTIVH
jgi:Tfp pilus assembly protein PilE